MPASTLEPVDAALRSALGKTGDNSNSLDIAGTKAKRALLTDVEFEPAGSYQSTILDKLKSKYVVLKNTDNVQNCQTENENGNWNTNCNNNNNSNGDCGGEETLKLPKYELYPFEAVQLGWSKCDWSVGAGMINMGNTCYLNSTLQALFHVPALVNWLISDKDHSQECLDSGGLCIICAMRKTLLDSQQRNTTTIRPLLIYNKLRLVCRNLIPGRQEDAHEFLRCLVEAMEKSYLSRFKNHNDFDSRVKETTPLNQILGGYLRSTVRCLKCGHISTTFQHFQDLLLDIRKAQTLDEALEGYFAREKLDDDSYHCQSCQKKVPATKQFSLERAPMVLCIQLKRFSVSNNKITKHIHFRQRLDLTRYARHRPNVPLIYRLVALVTHMGPTVNCGHYTAVAQAPTGIFYQFDDSMVRVISHQAVFNTNAYIMLYELESSPFAQKSNSITNTITVNNGIKSPLPSPEQIVNNNNIVTKLSDSGIGYTSDKVYGPELPPDRKINGNNCNNNNNNNNDQIRVNTSIISNVNGKQYSDNSSSDSDLENVQNGKTTQIKKQNNNNNNDENKSPLNQTLQNRNTPLSINQKLKNNQLVKLKNSSSSSPPSTLSSPSSSSSPSLSSINSSLTKQTITKLVPYETDDSSSCSDELNHSTNQINDKIISTKAANGEWKITQTKDVIPSQKNGENNNNNNNKAKTTDNTINELLKMSHSGYSAPVQTWNGTRSQLDKEITNDRHDDRKRTLQDNSDDQQGRVKHQKLNNPYKSNPGYNPVQEFHNAKNWSRNGGSGHYKHFYSANNRHRRNFHHKNFHKKYRFRQ